MDLKQWLCRNKHALGMIRLNGDGVPQLMVYRHAVDYAAERPAEVDVLGPLTGTMPVHCDVEGCDDWRLWDISVQALAELVLGLRQEQLEQLQARLLKGRVRKVTRKKNLARF